MILAKEESINHSHSAWKVSVYMCVCAPGVLSDSNQG